MPWILRVSPRTVDSSLAIATGPGVVMHELAHWLACKLSDTPVYEVCLFRFGNPAGFVVHGPPHSYGSAFLICVAPLFLNTIGALLFFAYAVYATQDALRLLACWLGASLSITALPSSVDADGLWGYSKRALRNNYWALLGFPVVVIIRIADVVVQVVWGMLASLALGILVPLIKMILVILVISTVIVSLQ